MGLRLLNVGDADRGDGCGGAETAGWGREETAGWGRDGSSGRQQAGMGTVAWAGMDEDHLPYTRSLHFQLLLFEFLEELQQAAIKQAAPNKHRHQQSGRTRRQQAICTSHLQKAGHQKARTVPRFLVLTEVGEKSRSTRAPSCRLLLRSQLRRAEGRVGGAEVER